MTKKKILEKLNELGYSYEEDFGDIFLENGTFSLRIDKNKHKIVVLEANKNHMCEMSEELLKLSHRLARKVWIKDGIRKGYSAWKRKKKVISRGKKLFKSLSKSWRKDA